MKPSFRLKKTALFVGILGVSLASKGQGTLYLSNANQTPGFDQWVYNTGWFAQGFITGGNGQGYALNSVSLGMDSSVGSPSGFSVAIYGSANGAPSALISVLSGASNPVASGAYSYTATDIALSADTQYFIVASATSPSGTGYYEWDPGTVFTSSYDWQNGAVYSSDDGGIDWSGARENVQAAIYATAVPEPSEWLLLLAGGGTVFCLTRTGVARRNG